MNHASFKLGIAVSYKTRRSQVFHGMTILKHVGKSHENMDFRCHGFLFFCEHIGLSLQLYYKRTLWQAFSYEFREILGIPLREKCPNTEFFLVFIFPIRTEYGNLLRKSPYSVRMREIRTRKNSVFGHFSHSVRFLD